MAFFFPQDQLGKKNLSQAYSFLNPSCSSSLVKVLNMKPCSPIYSLAKPACSTSISWAVSPSGWGWFLFVLSSTELLGRTWSERINQHYHLQRGNHLLHVKRGYLFLCCFWVLLQFKECGARLLDGVQSNDILVICTSWESICWQGLGGSLVSLFPFKFQERRISYNDTLQPRYIRSVPPLLASSADQPQRLQHSPGIRSTSESRPEMPKAGLDGISHACGRRWQPQAREEG